MRQRIHSGLSKKVGNALPPPWLLVAITLLLPAAAGAAEEDADIVLLCHLVIGEFGSDAIDACVKDNRAARTEVRRQAAGAPSAVARCTSRWEPNWVTTLRCVDAELAATAALRGYTGDEAMLLRCREQFGEAGDTEVKACVDRGSGVAPPASGATAANGTR
jgi:hypothetical protein